MKYIIAKQLLVPKRPITTTCKKIGVVRLVFGTVSRKKYILKFEVVGFENRMNNMHFHFGIAKYEVLYRRYKYKTAKRVRVGTDKECIK